ncbi:MAG: lipopolysaccharide biosynthesis protein [Thiohalocapsa sp.]
MSNTTRSIPLSPRRDSLVRRALVLNTAHLGNRVVTGGFYTIAGIVIRTVLTIGSVAVLARLLTPADFGYVAMATVITELAALLGNFGFGNILIQRPTIARLHLDTIFWTSTALGSLLALLVFVLSVPASWAYDAPLTTDLLRVLSITFIINGMTVAPDVVLARLMMFRNLFWIQIGSLFLRATVAIVCAYFDLGVWSLVAGGVSGTLGGLLLTTLVVRYRPRFRFNGAYLRSIWWTSASYFGSGILYYANTNVDLFLVGRQLGPTTLGFYQNARSITDEVRLRFAIPLQRVLFPAFSSLQNDRERLQQSTMRSGRLLAAMVFPVGIGIMSIAEELVPLLYGSRWLPMIPALQMLALASAVRGSAAIATAIFNSQNRVGLALKYNTVGSLLMIIGVLLTTSHGIGAVATAIAVTSLFALVSLQVAFRLIDLPRSSILRMFSPPVVASVAMWSSIYFIRGATNHFELTSPPALILHAAAGAVVYLGTLLLVAPNYFADFRAIIEKLGRTS